jgi:hypothetical protein
LNPNVDKNEVDGHYAGRASGGAMKGLHLPPLHSHSEVHHLTTERDWSRGLDEAASLDALRDHVARWMPFVPDAKKLVTYMDEESFFTWRLGLSVERELAKQKREPSAPAHFAWMEQFATLLVPTILGDATLMGTNLHVPLGTILLRAGPTLLAERGWAS